MVQTVSLLVLVFAVTFEISGYGDGACGSFDEATMVPPLLTSVDGGRKTVMRTFFNLPFSTVSSFPAFCACLLSCLAVNFRLNSDFSRPDIPRAIEVSGLLSAVFGSMGIQE